MCKDFIEAVENGCRGLNAVSVGPCPGCSECVNLYGYGNIKEFDSDYETGKVCAEPHFSWSPCGICGSSLGGNREEWHWVDDNNVVCHEPDCLSC